MGAATAPNGHEAEIRAIIFQEGGIYVGQCLEYDIAAQSNDLASLLDKLELAVDAEFQTCLEKGCVARECISPAPVYYHSLWDKRAVTLARVGTPEAGKSINYALAQAA